MNAPRPHPHAQPHPDSGRALCREDLTSGSLRDAYLQTELADLAWSDAQLQRSLNQTLRAVPRNTRSQATRPVPRTTPRAPATGDIWIFAYGSLIWNPIFPFAEKRIARIYGLHRSFCLWSRVGRGTREQPGLVLGLDDGGSCSGLVLRIEEHHARDELFLVWRREMVTGAYTPTWVKARTPQGTVNAIAFVMNQHSHAYAGRLPEDKIVQNIREAAGLNGRCSEYLAHTAAGLAAHGIADPALARLARMCGCASAPESGAV